MYYEFIVFSQASALFAQSGDSPASFRRVFSLGHLILFGVTFVGPTAPFPMFGIVSSASKGHMALAYLIAMVVMMLTAFSYGRMASAFPEAGSAYAYAGKALHPLAGIVAGWTILLDCLLPSRIFACIHPKYSTPTYGILAMGVVTLLGGSVLSFQLAAEAINFGVLLGFMFVNLSVVNHHFVRGGQRAGVGLLRNLLLPAGGFTACLYVFVNLSATAKHIGVVWCVFGLLYAAWRSRGFRRLLRDGASERAFGAIDI